IGALQWGRDHLVAETMSMCPDSPRSSSCFNGAATIWSRKRSRARGAHAASGCFNGAATIWSRKRDPIAGLYAERARRLQWGRDHLVAETEPPDSGGDRHHSASMGPRPSGRGNGSNSPGHAALSLALQWGRDHLVAETGCTSMPAQMTLTRLQWGRDHLVAETWRTARRRGSIARFNGAATIWSRKPPAGEVPRDHAGASMGPRPSGRGNENDGRESVEALQRASMWPRPSGRGNENDGCESVDALQRASMGPRPSGRGNQTPISVTDRTTQTGL